MRIRLSDLEMWHALFAVQARIIDSASKKLNNATIYKRTFVERISEEFVGICGEIAVAKAQNQRGKLKDWWLPPLGNFHNSGDVGKLNVRATRHENGHLVIRDNDDPNGIYVLVVGDPPFVRIAGWIKGTNAMEVGEYKAGNKSPKEGWWVKQHQLALWPGSDPKAANHHKPVSEAIEIKETNEANEANEAKEKKTTEELIEKHF